MGKQGPAARWLPLQRFAEPIGIDTHQNEAVLAGKMLGCRLFGLLGGGEMDVSVAKVDGRALEDAGWLGFLPERLGADLVDDHWNSGAYAFATAIQISFYTNNLEILAMIADMAR
jgi:hypothetical protein